MDCEKIQRIDELESYCTDVELEKFVTMDSFNCNNQPNPSRKLIFEITPKESVLELIIEFSSILNNEIFISVFNGDCQRLNSNELFLDCIEIDVSENKIQTFIKDLIPSQEYVLVIQIENNQLDRICFNNFQPLNTIGGDCSEALVLCNQKALSIKNVVVVNNVLNEMDGTSCYDGGEDKVFWFKWICDEPGNLTFNITPVNIDDDYDFVTFELPNGINDCVNRRELRCMASGEDINRRWRKYCRGSTGLRAGESDVSEDIGCPRRNNSYLKPLSMESGKAYALAIINYSNSANGFGLEFEGEATFLGPKVSFQIDQTNIACDDTLTFNFQISSPFGEITRQDWYFGEGGVPLKEDNNEIKLVYENFGRKNIYTEIETSNGCINTFNDFIDVDECCRTNKIQVGIESLKEPSCFGYSDGQIDIQVTGGFDDYGYDIYVNKLDKPISIFSIGNLSAGEHDIMVVDGKGCEVEIDTTLLQPEEFILHLEIDKNEIELGEIVNASITYLPDSSVLEALYLSKDSLDCFLSDCSQFMDRPFRGKEYTIIGRNIYSCYDTVSAAIDITFKRDVFVPNAINSGAKDLKNQFFTLYSNGNAESMHLQIFNRWGALLFNKEIPLNQPALGWDGKHQGQFIESGEYIYQAEVKYLDQYELIKSGSFTFLK